MYEITCVYTDGHRGILDNVSGKIFQAFRRSFDAQEQKLFIWAKRELNSGGRHLQIFLLFNTYNFTLYYFFSGRICTMLRAAQSEDLHSVRWQDHQQEQNLQTTSKTKGELVFPIQRETVLEYRLLLLLTPRNVRGELFLLHCGLSVKTHDVSLEGSESWRLRVGSLPNSSCSR